MRSEDDYKNKSYIESALHFSFIKILVAEQVDEAQDRTNVAKKRMS